MIIGHQKQLKLLRGFLENNLFFSSYLFWGPEKIGKKQLALEFAKGLLCQKGVFNGCSKCLTCLDAFQRDFLLIDGNFLPNLIIKSEDEKPYGIDTSRAIIKFLSTSPSVAQRKVVLIDNAHLLTQEAQNSLLKIIEEPPSNAVIILVSHKPSFLYDTILSRLLQIYFPLVNEKELSAWVKNSFSINAKEAEARLADSAFVATSAKEAASGVAQARLAEASGVAQEIARFSLGRPGRASEFVNDKNLLSGFRKEVLKLLSFEGKTSGQKLILLKNFFGQETDLSDSLSLWQGILRDELLFSCGLEDLAVILSQKRRLATTDLVASLKKLLSLSDLSDNFPATAEAAFKQMVLSKSL